jgi:catechol 2,3-dioxygenase-like lactoylglutathione lyase family enzyme
MAIIGAEIGFVSNDRRLVDFLAQVFQLEELDAIDVDDGLMDELPAAQPATQYRLRGSKGLILKVTVPKAKAHTANITDHVLAGTGLRYVTFYVPDLDGVVTRATELGGVIEQPPTPVMGSSLALIKDPDGNTYELAEIRR